MSSRITLVVLNALAVASLLVVILDSGASRDAKRRDMRVVPEYSRDAVTGLRIDRPGKPALSIQIRDGLATIALPHKAAVDESALEDLLGTIDVLTYRRASTRREAHGLETPRVTITLELGRKSVTIQLGASVTEIDRVWIGREGQSRSMLIDGYAARALDATEQRLRSGKVFYARPDEVTGVELHARGRSLVLSGSPLTVHGAGPGRVRMDPRRAQVLLDNLDGLVLARFAPPPPADFTPAEQLLQIRVVGARGHSTLGELGPCSGHPTQRLVETSAGHGCVEAAALASVAGLLVAPATLYDHSLVGVQAVSSVVIAKGPTRFQLNARGGGWQFADGSEASADAVRSMLVALGQPRPAVPVPDGAEAHTTLRLETRGEVREISILAAKGKTLGRRDAEPVAFILEPETVGLVATSALAYRDRTLIALESSSLVEAVARNKGKVIRHVTRGALLEDWTVRIPVGAGPALPTLRQLRTVAAGLRAIRFVAPSANGGHGLSANGLQVELQFQKPLAPAGKRVVHRISLGARTKLGCFARFDDDPAVVELDAAACAALRAQWTR